MSPEHAIACPVRKTRNSVFFMGVYRSISELASLSRIPERVLRMRLRNGWSVRNALAKSYRPIVRDQKHLLFGKEVSTSELGVMSGLGTECVRDRIASGMNPEEVMSTPKRKKVFITHDGKTMTVKEWSEKTGLSENVIRKRFERGYSSTAVLSPAGRLRLKRNREAELQENR
jgi:hypothetical protein